MADAPPTVALTTAVSTPSRSADVDVIPYLAWGNRGDAALRASIPLDGTS